MEKSLQNDVIVKIMCEKSYAMNGYICKAHISTDDTNPYGMSYYVTREKGLSSTEALNKIRQHILKNENI